MKRSQRSAVGLMVALGLGLAVATAPAYAHGGRRDCEGMGMRHEKARLPRFEARTEKHLAHLKAKLDITPDQEQAWQAFADKLKGQAAKMRGRYRQAAQEGPKAWPDRIARQVGLMQRRLAGMQQVEAAARQLYQVLTPEQRSIADKHMGYRRR